MTEKTVYFLGAGATKAVAENAPLNKDLVRKALKDFPDEPAAKNIKAFISRLFLKRKDPPIDNQIWNLLDYVIQQNRAASPEYSLEKIRELREGLLGLVIREFQKSLANPEGATYAKFAVATQRSPSAIISTNYDILMDNALAEVSSYDYGPKVRYAVSSEVVKVRGMKKPNKGGIVTEDNVNTGNVPLLKIHGSLNWLYCRKCDEVDVSIRTKGIKDALTGLYCCDDRCTNKYEPLLITPTMFKNYENRFVEEVWQRASEELRDAKRVVFIGYALKDEDYQIRCLLMNALLNREKSYAEVIVIEQEKEQEDEADKKKEQTRLQEIETKYRDLYGSVTFRKDGFKKFVDALPT